MRKQEREMMKCNKYDGEQLYVGGRRQENDLFPEKKITFYFNCLRNLNADVRSRGVGSSKDFEIRGVLEKEPRSVGRTSYQADRHGYLHEVKIESLEHMLDWVNNRSTRSAGTKKSEPNQRSVEEPI
jgi:hypothetical protein